MSNELEAAIRTSLQESSEHLTPDPDLAGQVRRATRRRRARLAIAGSLATAIIGCAGGYVVAAPGQHWPPWPANGYHAGHGGGTRGPATVACVIAVGRPWRPVLARRRYDVATRAHDDRCG